MNVQAFFSIGVGTVVLLFVSIRVTGLVWYLYIPLPCIAVGCMGTTLLILTGVIKAQKAAQSVLGEIEAGPNHVLMSLAREERKKVLKISKALRRIRLDVGTFTEISLAVPIGMCEEVLNQLLFLLAY